MSKNLLLAARIGPRLDPSEELCEGTSVVGAVHEVSPIIDF